MVGYLRTGEPIIVLVCTHHVISTTLQHHICGRKLVFKVDITARIYVGYFALLDHAVFTPQELGNS